MLNLKDIVNEFAVEGKVEEVKPLGAGHINDSYIVRMQGNAPGYVLQRINHHIFKDVDALQSNIKRVTDHIRKKLSEKNEPEVARKVLTLTPTTQGALYHRSPDGGYWRMMPYIANSKSVDEVSPKLSFFAGRAFGNFQSMLADLPAPPLVETIPNFHNIESRLATFREAVKHNLAGRLAKVEDIVAEIEKRADEMCKVEQLHRDGKLPKRINHCDTKVNNILFDGDTDEVLCVVDLDTVMPGFVVSDFGDFMRTGANHGKEDDENLDNVFFLMDIFEAYAKGYLETAKCFLTPLEVELLPFGAKLLTYMQTLRFLTDYLDGDTYYKIKHPEHNLQRTKAQLKLLLSMEENYPKMLEIIRSL
ncbi:MAG: aminoglycoside phosphotransferase family protein [Prevotellaceae bacterium]|jgi:Ser/Thr protein kinase RdoA (MazF antagonist)|nr:aminoglycoside phosphotransferase family protein [Prevotellaceae bacterium]